MTKAHMRYLIASLIGMTLGVFFGAQAYYNGWLG